MENKPPRLPYLEVKLGDEIVDIKSKRLGWVHKKKIFGSKNAFIVTWMDNGEKTAFISRRDHQKIKRTGNNINDSDSDSD